MKLEVDIKSLSKDVDIDDNVGVRENIIENLGYNFLDDWVLSYYTDDRIVFLTKDYIKQILEDYSLDEPENYFQDYDFFYEIGGELANEVMGIVSSRNNTYFESLSLGIYDIMCEKYKDIL